MLAVGLRRLALVLLGSLPLGRILLRRLAVGLLVLAWGRLAGGRSLAGWRLLVAGIVAALRGLAVLGRLLRVHVCGGKGRGGLSEGEVDDRNRCPRRP